MKNIKSFSVSRKRFVLFSVLSLLALCSPIAFAQDKNRQQVSFAELQTETDQAADDKVISESIHGVGESGKTASRDNFSHFPPVRVESEKHGIIKVFASETTTENEASENKGEFFAAPKIEPNGNKIFFSPQSIDDFEANGSATVGKDLSFVRLPASARGLRENKNSSDDPTSTDLQNGKSAEGFRWGPALRQSLLFLAVQHGYAFTQPKTREALKGRFFHDYIQSVKSLSGWADGGRFFTNYIAHPMQGSFVGFIQIQNDPKGIKQRFGGSGDYWRSRLKAMAWSAAWSTQFEIGPISQASIGNVGLKGKQTYVDLVMTPTLGTAMLVSEDALDRFVIERIERATNNFYLIIFSRMLLNPTRTVANLIRFKHPWYRDRARAR